MHGFFRTVSLKLERALGSGWACGADICVCLFGCFYSSR